MEEGEGGGLRLSKRFCDKNENGEVDYKTKAGSAWSHSYLNQKPWHPLSYPNQRRKWIAEQTHAQRQRRAEDVAREYAQEQEFLRQTSLFSQKEKEKMDIMQAVSFMYVKPPGYNAESAKAAEIADAQGGKKKLAENETDPTAAVSSLKEKKTSRPKDVFGRTLPTEEEFAVLKNAPRLETGVLGRAKPFAVEVRNVKCVRCGNFGHQSGDRECPMKDAIMPNDEYRLKRDDPLNTIIAHTESSEPLKWELRQKPGLSPPRGGFMPDDPNQQIVADEDIFDEYGGFLGGGGIPEILANISSTKNKRKKSKSKSKHRKEASSRRGHEDDYSTSSDDDDRRVSRTKSRSKSNHRKEASSRRGHEDDYSTSSDDDDRRISRTKLRSKSKREKRAPSLQADEVTDSSSENEERRRRSRKKERLYKSEKKALPPSSMSEDSERERYCGEARALHTRKEEKHISPSCSDENRWRYRGKEKSHKNNKEKDTSHSSLLKHSDSRGQHGKSKHEHSHQSGRLNSDKYKDCGSSRGRASRVFSEDSSSEGERKLKRKEDAWQSQDNLR